MDAGEGGSADADGHDATELDAGVIASSCYVRSGSESVVAERYFDPQGAVSVAASTQGALLSWSQYSAGKAHVFSRWFGVDADAIDAPSVALESTQVDVHSAATATGFITTWSDDSSGHSELRARRTAANGVSSDSMPIAVTSEGVNHGVPVSAQGADGKILIAFLDGTTQHGNTLLLGSDLKPVAAAHAVPGFDAIVGRPALAAFRDGYLLAWVDSTARRVHFQKLDATGLPAGVAVLIDAEGNAQGNLDLATTATDGAITWDVLVAGERAEVRFRTFDMAATPIIIEQTVSQFPDTGLHPSLVATRGGYLVAYRSVQASASTLRIVMLDGRGKPVSADHSALTITSLQQQDLPLAMRMTSDGRNVFLGWLDQTPNVPDYQLQRAWIGCN